MNTAPVTLPFPLCDSWQQQCGLALQCWGQCGVTGTWRKDVKLHSRLFLPQMWVLYSPQVCICWTCIKHPLWACGWHSSKLCPLLLRTNLSLCILDQPIFPISLWVSFVLSLVSGFWSSFSPCRKNSVGVFEIASKQNTSLLNLLLPGIRQDPWDSSFMC